MSQIEKRQEAMRVFRRLGNRAILGGYPRDIIFGVGDVVPKDIDVWVARQGRPLEDLMRTAEDIFAKAKQHIAKVHDGAQYGNGTVVISSDGASDIEPVEVIFHPGLDARMAMNTFDIDLCKCYIGHGGMWSSPMASESYVTNRILVNATHDYVKYADHLRRVLAKFPNMKVLADLRGPFITRTYQALVEEGVINAPRQVLQAQGQDVDRDQVGLQAGGVNLQQAREINWEHVGQVFDRIRAQEAARVGIPQGQAQVHNPQVVPARFFVDDVERLFNIR